MFLFVLWCALQVYGLPFGLTLKYEKTLGLYGRERLHHSGKCSSGGKIHLTPMCRASNHWCEHLFSMLPFFILFFVGHCFKSVSCFSAGYWFMTVSSSSWLLVIGIMYTISITASFLTLTDWIWWLWVYLRQSFFHIAVFLSYHSCCTPALSAISCFSKSSFATAGTLVQLSYPKSRMTNFDSWVHHRLMSNCADTAALLCCPSP